MVVTIYTAFTWKVSKYFIDDFILKVPLLSALITYSNFSNFVAVMQVAYEAGIPIIDCLFLSNITITNHQVLKKLKVTLHILMLDMLDIHQILL